MSKTNTPGPTLIGTGAAYIRVSTDQQDTDRQYASIREFERRNKTSIPKHHWYEDEGWARDADKHRPAFNRLLALANAGGVQWIVVDRLDRFGAKSAKHLMGYLAGLEDAGCRLFDTSGREWTGQDAGTEITAWLGGRTSSAEQREKSSRVIGGKASRAREGEWQGGPVRLGFDVGCFSRETGKELWRVVYEGRNRRLKVYPDGRTERFDGDNNFPQSQPQTEVLRVTPSRDAAKVAAAASVFKRYASEAISFTALAHYLNKLGYRSSYDGHFHGHHIGRMLEDPIYIGYYTWNRTHHGKFHRYTGGRAVEELNYDEKVTANDKADWVQSERLFEPLVDAKTWAAVQAKLGKRERRAKAPTTAALYLSGLIYCGNCAGRMVAGPARKKTSARNGNTDGRHEYICGTYHRAVREGKRDQCSCLRNGVFQDVVEAYIWRYLEDSGRRLELLTGRQDAAQPAGRLETQETDAWREYCEGVDRLIHYLAKHHPGEYAQLIREDRARRELAKQEQPAEDRESRLLPPSTLAPAGALVERYGKRLVDAAANALKVDAPAVAPDDFVAELLYRYRSNFDPTAVAAEIARLDAEHTRLTRRYADLPTPRAREKAAAELGELENRIKELERHRDDAAGEVERHYGRMLDLQRAMLQAKLALQSGDGERALRQRAEALRAVVQRVECTFAATGNRKGGPGGSKSRLVYVKVYPVCGDAAEFEGVCAAGGQPALRPTSVVSRW